LLAIFLGVRGRIRIHQGFSGTTLLRFASFERFTHWLTASCFVVLALSGLNISFGRSSLILPLFGADAFAAMSTYANTPTTFWRSVPARPRDHVLIWIKDNIPGKVDLEWFKQGGGVLFKGRHPPATRFNAGQKGIFGIVIIGGALMSLSGWFLLFPYIPDNVDDDAALDRDSCCDCDAVHRCPCLAHIYIGTIGMEGAFEAMGSGEVDLNWAKEHHSLWVAEEQAKSQAPSENTPRAVPAE